MLVILVLLVAGFTPIPSDPWWKNSLVIQRLLPLAEWAGTFLPESVNQHLDFYPEEPATKKIEPPEEEKDPEEKPETKTA